MLASRNGLAVEMNLMLVGPLQECTKRLKLTGCCIDSNFLPS
jgi:hypothetical protein